MGRRPTVYAVGFNHPFSLDFNGVDEEMTNSSSNLIGIANSWSIMMAFKPSTQSGVIVPLFLIREAGASVDNAISIITDSSDTDHDVILRDSAGVTIAEWHYADVDHFPLNIWHHAVYVWDGSTLKLYKNGTLLTPTVDPGSVPATMTDTARRVSVCGNLGAAVFGGDFGHYKVHQVAIWNTTLTQQQAAQLYNGGSVHTFDASTVATANLKHWWQLGKSGAMGDDNVSSGQITLSPGNITEADDQTTDIP